MEIQYANVRLPVQPGLAAGCCVPFSDIPRLGSVERGVAASVSATAVTLDNGTTLPYDHLVLAPGTGYACGVFKSSPDLSVASRAAGVAAAAKAVDAASSTVIIGGGPVGVEVAAELAADGKGGALTLVTRGAALLPGKPAHLSAAVETWLVAKGVTVVKGVAASVETIKPARRSGPAHRVSLGAGRPALDADVVYTCYAGAPNTGFLRGGPGDACLDGAGFIRVDAALAVVAAPASWYALGDACDAPGVKLGYLARGQAGVVVANVKAAARGAPASNPSTWAPNGGRPEMMLVTLGRAAGAGHLGAWVRFPSLAVWALKSRDLFVGKTRAWIGAPPAPAAA